MPVNGATARRPAYAPSSRHRELGKVRNSRSASDADYTKVPSSGLKDAASEKSLPWPATLFLTALIIPWIIDIGSLRLSIDRIILIVMIIPCLVLWLTGKAGKIRTADILVILYCLWCAVSLGAVHGVETSIQSGGMIAVETLGAYFLARVSVRNAGQFYSMALVMFSLVAFLLPFSIYESMTGKNLLLELYGSILPTQKDYFMAPRWGLRRVQSVFDHPILYGVFCTSMFALVHKTLGAEASPVRRWTRSGTIAAATFFSLSSGPLSALVVQGLLIAWEWFLRDLRYRWHILSGFFATLYLGISVLSNQSVFEFYVHYFAFSQDTGWDRIRIWHYGWLSVFNHPLFGIGYNEYQRPEWMEPSIDMFWLINFVRFGYPGGILMVLTFGFVFLTTALKKGLNVQQDGYRKAYLFSMIGIFTVGWTVHFWNAPYLLIMFYLGSASWMLDIEPGETTGARLDMRRAGRTLTRSP